MAFGAGTYDVEAQAIYDRTDADGVILLVFGGPRDTGTSVIAPPELLRILPDVLRNLAEQIEAQGLGS